MVARVQKDWYEPQTREKLGGKVCTNYTDNYCAALIKRRQQIRLLLVPNFAAILPHSHTHLYSREEGKLRRGGASIEYIYDME